MKIELVHAIHRMMSEIANSIHTAVPGEIIKVYNESGTADVKPLAKDVSANGSTIDYPILYNVPIVISQSQSVSTSLAFPVHAGDDCLIIISETTLDSWRFRRETGAQSKHTLTNAICIPGLSRVASSAFTAACNSESVVVRSGDTSLVVGESGVSINTPGSIQLSAGGHVYANGIRLDIGP